MIAAFWRKLRADIRTQKLQFLLVWGVLSLSSMLLVLSLLMYGSAEEPWDRIFEETNGAHVWVVSSIHDLDFSPIANHQAVEEVTGTILALSENPMILDDEKVSFYLYAMDALPEVAQPLIADGRWVNPENAFEVVLDFSLANYFGFQVGDEVSFLSTEGARSLRVVGLAITAHWFPYNEVTKAFSPGVAYISTQTYESLQPNPEFWYASYGLRLKNPDASKDFVDIVSETFPGQITTVIEWKWVRQIATMANTINIAFIGVFSLLGFASVSLIIFNTIGGQVLSQYRDIGQLKAVGFKPIQVVWLFLAEHLVIGALAVSTGIALALVVAPSIISPLAENLNTTPANIYSLGPLVLTFLLVEGAVVIATLLPAWRGGQIDTVQAITVGYQKRHRRASRLANMAAWLRLPVVVMLGVKDTFAKPLRTILTIAALVLSVVIAVTSVSGQATAGYLGQSRMYTFGTTADIKVARNFIPHHMVEDAILTHPEVQEYYEENGLYGRVFYFSDQPIFFRVLGGNYSNFDFQLKEGRMLAEPGEAVVGFAVLELLNAHIGDTVEMSVEGKPVRLKIVGRHTEGFNNNNVVIISKETYTELVDTALVPQAYYLRLQDYSMAEELRASWMEEFQDLIDVGVVTDMPLASISQLVNLIISIGAVLMIVASVNLMSNSLLGIRERVHDFGIQRSLGMTPSQIGGSVVIGTVAISIVALVIGIPLGYLFLKTFVSQVGIEIGAGPDFYIIHWGWISALLPIIILLAIISSLLPAYRASRMQVVEALRYE